jgi:hypothetical protein
MSENRETTSADRYQASRMWRGYRLRQGRRNQIFFTKHFHKVKMFCEEDKKRTMLPQANRASTWSNVRFDEPPRNSSKRQALRSR